MDEMNKTIIYDGNNTAHRMFAASTGSDDKYAVAGWMVVEAARLNKEFGTTRSFCVWDGGIAGWRRELVPTYKVKEKRPDADEFRRQRDQARRVLEGFGQAQITVPGAEADDVVAQMIELVRGSSDLEVIIVSTDKDFWQLVDGRVSVYDPIRKRLVTEKTMPQITAYAGRLEWMLYRAMVGDASDRIPGVKGIGEKKAATIVARALGRAVPGLMTVVDGVKAGVKEVKGDEGVEQLKAALRVMRLPRLEDGMLDGLDTVLKEVNEKKKERIFGREKVLSVANVLELSRRSDMGLSEILEAIGYG